MTEGIMQIVAEGKCKCLKAIHDLIRRRWKYDSPRGKKPFRKKPLLSRGGFSPEASFTVGEVWKLTFTPVWKKRTFSFQFHLSSRQGDLSTTIRLSRSPVSFVFPSSSSAFLHSAAVLLSDRRTFLSGCTANFGALDFICPIFHSNVGGC